MKYFCIAQVIPDHSQSYFWRDPSLQQKMADVWRKNDRILGCLRLIDALTLVRHIRDFAKVDGRHGIYEVEIDADLTGSFCLLANCNQEVFATWYGATTKEFPEKAKEYLPSIEVCIMSRSEYQPIVEHYYSVDSQPGIGAELVDDEPRVRQCSLV